jgi:FtsZ-interacting cell division protein ZipA
MSDLQISLLAVGAAVVVGVYLFNLWQERKLRRRTEQAFAREHPDVLLEDAGAEAAKRVEPTIAVEAPAAVPAGTPVTPAAPVTAAPVMKDAPDALAIDPVIDYVAEVNLAAPVAGSGLRDELRALLAETGKAVLAEGYDAASGVWVDAVGTRQFARLRFGLQISNRGGAIAQAQLTAFLDAVTKWAGAREGRVKSLDIEAAHAMAVQLDRFCADVDIAIGVNVVGADGTPFTGARIRALAELNGLRLEPDGVFYARDEAGNVLYTLDNHEPMPFVPEQMRALHTRGVTFLLDVPRVAGALPAFDAMLATAREFAAELGGTLVDDNRAQLSDAAIAAIRKQLEGILAKMEAGRIAAGSARALRLFG